ncbi:hypothetical protein KIN_30460 [Litoreibacter roseus]|uniref:DUF2244 domain-containing protein n=1 Tax=Litoreibacter roseus TaxID=2601869 RepID=A0A6N6JLB1_9RHOB|nr:hypothetical protein KIN_30460 [Litoreibacter roseus]
MTFLAITSVLIAIPLLPLIGTTVLWGLLPFLVLTVGGLWYFLMRSYRDGHLVEELSIWPDHMTLVRVSKMGPKHKRRQEWEANPYWVGITSHEAPVKNYLTLSGGTREVELGAFLSPEERAELKDEVEAQLRNLAPGLRG